MAGPPRCEFWNSKTCSCCRSGGGAGQLFTLDPWEEAALAVIPSRSSVVLPQTQQQVQLFASGACDC